MRDIQGGKLRVHPLVWPVGSDRQRKDACETRPFAPDPKCPESSRATLLATGPPDGREKLKNYLGVYDSDSTSRASLYTLFRLLHAASQAAARWIRKHRCPPL